MLSRYEHYFQKDVALQHATGDFSGHRHEWENIVIWVKDGDNMPSYVSASQHDSYETKAAGDVRFQGMYHFFKRRAKTKKAYAQC